MKIELKKFGTTLTSRQAGKEAFAAFQPTLQDIPESEKMDVDFSGVITFTPSWGDEFLVPLLEKFNDRVRLLNTSDNLSVTATLQTLEKMHQRQFVRAQ